MPLPKIEKTKSGRQFVRIKGKKVFLESMLKKINKKRKKKIQKITRSNLKKSLGEFISASETKVKKKSASDLMFEMFKGKTPKRPKGRKSFRNLDNSSRKEDEKLRRLREEGLKEDAEKQRKKAEELEKTLKQYVNLSTPAFRIIKKYGGTKDGDVETFLKRQLSSQIRSVLEAFQQGYRAKIYDQKISDQEIDVLKRFWIDILGQDFDLFINLEKGLQKEQEEIEEEEKEQEEIEEEEKEQEEPKPKKRLMKKTKKKSEEELEKELKELGEQEDKKVEEFERDVDDLKEINKKQEEVVEEIEEIQKGGLMTNPEDALTNTEIDKIMAKYRDYHGTFPKDHFYKVISEIKPQTRGGAILNLDDSSKPGSHWVGVFYDGRPQGSHSVEYFDSFGRQPPSDIMSDLKRIPKKLEAGQHLKLKVNGVGKQHPDTVSCGYHAINYLLNRFRGKPFKSATGYNSIQKNEEKMEQMKKKFDFMLD